MERKTLIVYAVIVIVGLGLMVGVVLFLRARSLPQEPALGGTTVQTGGSGTGPQQGVPKYTPIDQIPVEAPYKEGDVMPSSTRPVFYGSPEGGFFTQ